MTRWFKVSLMKGSVLHFTKICIVYFLSGYNKLGLNCSWGKNCLKLPIYFYFAISLLAYKCWPSYELIKLNSFYQKCVVLDEFCFGSGEKIWEFSLCTLLYQQFRVIMWNFRVNSRKFRVISRELRVYSRKFRVSSRKN